LKSLTPNSLKSLEQQKAKERDLPLGCGMQKAELRSLLFAEAADTRDYLSGTRCNGVMGVPITFLEKYNPEQFEILGITLGNTVDYPMTVIYENAVQHNKDGSTQGGSKVNTRAAVLVKEKPAETVYYTADNADGYLLSIYPRILIRQISRE
jgi:hypothetical protein